MELDYYDYNVVNAGAAPGSYLGMDPAYLVWIPPLDDLTEFEDIRPKQYIDPGSNQESPEDEMLIPKRRKSVSEMMTEGSKRDKQKSSRDEEKMMPKRRKSLERLGMEKCRKNSRNEPLSISPLLLKRSLKKEEAEQKKLGVNSPVRVHKPSEKETEIEKSPSYDMDDIKFADDDDEFECNKNSYQDSNIIISNDS